MAEDSRGVDPRRREAAEQVYMMTMILIMLMMTTTITMGSGQERAGPDPAAEPYH